MKTILLSTFALMLSVFTFAQMVIPSPKTGMSTTENLQITKIELTDSATVLYFHCTYRPNNWISIPKETFIQSVGSSNKLFITATKGIPLGARHWMTDSGEVDYQLIFPKLEDNVTSIDYGEANGGGWNIFDIQVRKATHLSVIPDDLSGNWFNTKNGLWELSLLDSFAIYKSRVWTYSKLYYSNGKGSLILKNNGNLKKISLRMENSGLRITQPSEEDVCLCRTCPSNTANMNDGLDKIFGFKMDTAIFKGFIKGYSSRCGIKSFEIYTNDILGGDQSGTKVAIAENGEFCAKVPLCYAHSIYVKAGSYSGYVFLEPGKETFQMMESGEAPLYMGNCAKMNAEMYMLWRNFQTKFEKFIAQTPDSTPEQYKVKCMDLMQSDFDSLDILKRRAIIGAKSHQLMSFEMQYSYMRAILEYQQKLERMVKAKSKSLQSEKVLQAMHEKPGTEYYKFINNELLNNQLAIMSIGYNYFISSLKYAEIIRNIASEQTYLHGIAEMLEKSGYVFSDEERLMIDALQKTETPELKEFMEKNSAQIRNLYLAHADKLKDLLQKKRGNVLFSEIEKTLLEKGETLTEREKNLLKICIDQENSESAIKNRQTKEAYSKVYQQFMNKNKDKINSYYAQEQKKVRNEQLSKLFGIQPGLAIDIMNTQDICRGIVSELTPISTVELQKIRQQISIPFIVGYIETCNDQTKAKIEANKKLKGSVANEVPKVEPAKLFDAIVSKYKGKVVHVDFWATWCGPCRSGIENIKPLKEEMANENVAFVYITGETSPKTTYENMIPTIKGEHYRVSSDEWNFLCSQFNISGIPHYMLVDKNGNMISEQLGHMGNETLKSLLIKHIKE